MKKKLIALSVVASIGLGISPLQASNILDLTKEVTSVLSSKKQAKNQVIILFEDGVRVPSYFMRFIKKFTHQKYDIANAMFIKSSTMSTDNLIKLFSSSKFTSFIKKVEPNYIYQAFKSNDSYYSKLWAIENNGQDVNNKKGTVDADMDVSEAWEKEKGSHDIIVAVLDTGVDYTHNDLSDNMYSKLANHGYDFAGDNDGNNDDNPMPDKPYDEKGHYHGTHVAGIIGAVGDNSLGVVGVNQNVQILAVKVFRPNGYGYSNDILEGLDYVAKRIDNGDNVVAINASYGGGGSQDDATNRAIKNLGKKGVVFCAAAGNDGKNIDNDPVYPASYNATNIIAVAASNQDDKLASFSNYGKKSVDVSAPGTNILSTYPDNQYAYLQGTSMATPEVAGEVALLKAHNPNLSVDEVIKVIKDSVDKKSNLSNKIASGGRVNVNSAISGSNGGGEEESNNAPKANDDAAITNEDSSVKIDVLSNDSDADGDTLTISSNSNPSHGSVVKNSDNTLTYIPNNNYYGNDSFTYKISDGKGGESTAKVTVKVKSVNDAPIARDDSVKTDQDKKVLIDVLSNDSDADGDTLTIKSAQTPSHGSIKIKNNKIEYTPDNGFNGDDNFNYTIIDGNGGKSTASVTVTVKKKSSNNGGFFGGFFGGGNNNNGGWF